MKKTRLPLIAIVLTTMAAHPDAANASPAQQRAGKVVPGQDDAPVPIATLVKDVTIPYQMFTLANGLQVVVQTDRRARTVTALVDYGVGATSEPARRTGFAHLFEHLMFNGSENAPGDYAVPLQKVGATINGVTQYDRTAYYNMVPSSALEQVLFLESDRMGHLLGAISQRTLDEQRGVVQNEKRQRLDRSLGTVRERLAEKIYPAGHPYAHGIFGSMADLDAADLDDVRSWFQSHYGPNNAILSLTGDIDAATAKPLVEKYFGDIPAGPRNAPPPAPVPTLAARIDDRITDRIGTPHLYRAWAVPGLTDPAAAALRVAASTMSQDGGSLLRDNLVKRDKLFGSLSIALELYDGGGLFIIDGPLVAGVDPALAGRRLDETIAQAVRTRPSAEAIDLYITSEVSTRIAKLAGGGGDIGAVVEGLRLGKGPDFYKTQLQALASQTPDSVQAAATTWFTRPAYALTVMPGSAPPIEIAAARPIAPATAAPAPVIKGKRGGLPPEGTFADVQFPKADYAQLSNGIEVVYMRGGTVPYTEVAIDFDIGTLADPLDGLGTQAMLLAMLDKGTTTRDGATITLQRQRLGASIDMEADADRTSANLSVPTANLQPALNLMADMLRNPAFPTAQLETERQDRLAQIAADQVEGGSAYGSTLARLIDATSPYVAHMGPGDAKAVARLTVQDLRAFQHSWLRPDKATIFVISNAPLPQVTAMLEKSFGDWRAEGRGGVKDHATTRTVADRTGTAGIVLLDRPGSDQAVISAGQDTAFANDGDLLEATIANMALADGNTNRLNGDLRETKGWTYGLSGRFDTRKFDSNYVLSAPVQQDRAGDSIAVIRQIIGDFVSSRTMTQAEFDAAIQNRIRALSVDFDGSRSYIAAIRANRLMGRPDDYQATLADRYRALKLKDVQAAIQKAVDPKTFVWVVMGDAAKIKPQLEPLGLPVTVLPPPETQTP